MIKENYIFLEAHPSLSNRYLLSINFDKLPPMRTTGSYQVLFARLLNLSFAQYLRFCRDYLKAEVIGKDSTYPTVYFKKTKEVVNFVRMLNTRMNLVIWEREHPDWEEHQNYIKYRKQNKILFNKENGNVDNN